MSEKVFWVTLIFIILVGSIYSFLNVPTTQGNTNIPKFDSCMALSNSFKEAYENNQYRYYGLEDTVLGGKNLAAPTAGAEAGVEYSETNVQVEGVDEADIVKTDGKYIYTLSGENLIIVLSYPPEQAEILSETKLDISPSEMFIDGDRLLVFGQTYSDIILYEQVDMIYPPPSVSLTTVQLWNIKDRENPELVRSLEFEGVYVTSRKIDSQVYFVISSYPRVYIDQGTFEDIVPQYRDRSGSDIENEAIGFTETCGCAEVRYFDPIVPESFITVASMSMSDDDADITKEVIVGSGENVYASLDNLYIAESNYWYWGIMGDESSEKTNVHKFSLDDGKITYVGKGEVEGTVLNQFSMDEYEGNFRIATTEGHVSRTGGNSVNNVYVYNEDMELIGELEDLAPGERIYSARFMGERGYLVTFKKVDPLFVIDLSDPYNPKVLGKLKIPGYSDYLHPYDENHIIGVGKETVEAEEGDFAWYQGVKMAIFDVSDVNNPVELHKVVIGDRGTDSYALQDHKAFLFDKERNLLVIPVLLAQIDEDIKDLRPNSYGDYVYQGAFVFDVTLDDGFQLRGTVTHYDDEDAFIKSGYYFYGDYNVQRSLFIDDVLYTISQKKIKLNSLDDLSEIKELLFG